MFLLEAGAYASPSDGYLTTGIAPDEAKLDGAAFYARFGVQDWGKQNAHGGLARC